MKTLSQTNPYLKDKETARLLNARSARTSCGVEGIQIVSSAKTTFNIDTSRSKAVLLKMKNRLNPN